MEKTIDNYLPLLCVEMDCILSKAGEITIAYEVELPEIFTLCSEEYEALHQVWVKALKVLPQHTVIHKQDWFIGRKYEPEGKNKNNSFLTHCSEQFFQGRHFHHHQCYLFLTKKPKGSSSTTLFSSLCRSSIVPEETIKPQHLQEFLGSASQMERILMDGGFVRLRRIKEKELLSNRKEVGLIEKYCSLVEQNQLPQLRDIAFGNNFNIGEKYLELYTLADVEELPSLCGSRTNYDKYSTDRTKFSVGFAAPLGVLLPCSHIYNQYIFLEDASKTLKRLESKRLRLQSLSAYSRENSIARNATSAFLNEAIGEQRLAVKAHFNVLVWTDDREKLNELRNLVASALSQMDAGVKIETVGAPQIFWAGIPGGAGDFPMNDTFLTFLEQACCFLNEETNYKSDQGLVSIRLGDRLTGRPVYADISDEPMRRGIITNRNKFILGPSGSGKSFFTNHMVRSYYEQGTHIVLVDVGHSYKGLCSLVNGYYFTYEENNPIRFNPFYISKGDSLDTEKLESIKALLLSLWKKVDTNYERSEYVAVSSALLLYYQHLKSNSALFPCFNTFYEFLQTEFVSVLREQKVKEKDFDFDNFLFVLRPYYRGGEFDYLLNATENLDLLGERFIVFELDNIKDHPILFPVVTIIIMEVFVSKMRKLKDHRKMILIEEAWKAIAREGMAEYIKYLFKTVRKHFGEAVVVTQEVEDIISSPIVKQAIINNADCKILLDQSKYQNKFEAIQELLGLSEKEKAMVLSINRANDPTKRYKEVFISLGGMLSKVYRTEVSPEEYLAYTTEQREKIKVTEYAGRYGSIEKGIEVLAQEMQVKAP